MKATAPVHRIALLDCDRLSNKYQRQRRPQEDQRPLTSQPDGQLSGHRQQDRVNVGGRPRICNAQPGGGRRINVRATAHDPGQLEREVGVLAPWSDGPSPGWPQLQAGFGIGGWPPPGVEAASGPVTWREGHRVAAGPFSSGSGQRQRYNPRRSAITSTHAGTGCAPRIRSSRSNAVTSSGGGGSGGGHDQSAGPGDRTGFASAICKTRRYAALSSR